MLYDIPIKLKHEAAKTITLGKAGKATRQEYTLGADIKRITDEDLASLVRQLVIGEIYIQERIGNPVQITESDGKTNVPVTQAKRKATAVFGTKLVWAAVQTVESVLRSEILKSSTTRTGALSDTASRWQWLLIKRDGSTRPVSSEGDLDEFRYGDKLIVYPVDAASYAWFVNRTTLSINKRLHAESGKKERRNKRPGGFMSATSQALRRNAKFKNFQVYASFSQKFKPANYKSGHAGLPFIAILPRTRQR